MKRIKWLERSNIVTALFFLFLLTTQLPSLIKNFGATSQIIPVSEYPEVLSGKPITFPPPQANSVTIFWASWCGPCKLEMNRFKKSVENNRIPADKIFAINPFESELEARNYLLKNNFPFTFITAPEIVKMLEIDKTPTILLIEKQKILSMSSGISLIGIWRAENLF